MRQKLEAGERWPQWTDADLKPIVPDTDVHRTLLAELHPQPLAYYAEPLSVFEGWPDAPCAYLHFSPPYNGAAERAQQIGWLYRKLDGGHFHMLVEPQTVANALLELTEIMGNAHVQKQMSEAK